MKRINRYFALFTVMLSLVLLTACATKKPVTPVQNADFTIKLSWSYDFTNFAQCSPNVTKGCISGFTWGYLQGTTQVPLKSSATSACTGSTQPLACSDTVNSQLPMGSLTWYGVVNFVDNNGIAGSSAAATSATPSVITAGTMNNLSATITP